MGRMFFVGHLDLRVTSITWVKSKSCMILWVYESCRSTGDPQNSIHKKLNWARVYESWRLIRETAGYVWVLKIDQ